MYECRTQKPGFLAAAGRGLLVGSVAFSALATLATLSAGSATAYCRITTTKIRIYFVVFIFCIVYDLN